QVLDWSGDEDLESLGMKGSAVRIRASALTKSPAGCRHPAASLGAPFASLLSFGNSAIQGRSKWRLCRVLVRLGADRRRRPVDTRDRDPTLMATRSGLLVPKPSVEGRIVRCSSRD